MTFIVAGKFNNNPFLMVDCVGTSADGKHGFCNKLAKLRSTQFETYSTITGYDAFQIAINLFDKKCYENDVNFDIENVDHINEILQIYNLLKNNEDYTKGFDIEKDFLYSGLFFIESGKVCYYIIKKDDNDKMYIHGKNNITNNQISESLYSLNISNNQFKNNDEIIEYCKAAITKHYKRKTETIDLDLKDKFSFIMFNNDNKIKIFPYNNNEELVLSELGSEYKNLK